MRYITVHRPDSCRDDDGRHPCTHAAGTVGGTIYAEPGTAEQRLYCDAQRRWFRHVRTVELQRRHLQRLRRIALGLVLLVMAFALNGLLQLVQGKGRPVA